MEAEAEAIWELSTHWTNAQPIGNVAGPVVQKQLVNGLANTENRLLSAGGYEIHSHSPVMGLNPNSVKDLEVA
jgi:hypothetical protein